MPRSVVTTSIMVPTMATAHEKTTPQVENTSHQGNILYAISYLGELNKSKGDPKGRGCGGNPE